MTFETIITVTLAMILLALPPGPGIAAVVARALSSGFGAAMTVNTGLIIGDVIFMSLALTGLSTLASAAGPVFVIVKYAGAAYLIWLGVKVFKTAAVPIAVQEAPKISPWRELGMGLLVGLGNPKPILFYGALLPTFLDISRATL